MVLEATSRTFFCFLEAVGNLDQNFYGQKLTRSNLACFVRCDLFSLKNQIYGDFCGFFD